MFFFSHGNWKTDLVFLFLTEAHLRGIYHSLSSEATLLWVFIGIFGGGVCVAWGVDVRQIFVKSKGSPGR